MREVLSLHYSAASRTLLSTVAAVKESEHVPGTFVRQLGVPDPKASVQVDELPEHLRESFDELLEWLLPIVEEKHAAVAANPTAMALKASDLAAREQALLERERELTAREGANSPE